MLALLLIGVLFCGALSKLQYRKIEPKYKFLNYSGAPTNEEKVIGGRDAAEGEIPYIVTFSLLNNRSETILFLFCLDFVEELRKPFLWGIDFRRKSYSNSSTLCLWIIVRIY